MKEIFYHVLGFLKQHRVLWTAAHARMYLFSVVNCRNISSKMSEQITFNKKTQPDSPHREEIKSPDRNTYSICEKMI